ncbi:MAG: hypothetical protein Hens2KO_24700 [Henriciella sp.]
MVTEPRPQTGLKLGLISLVLVTVALVGVFLFGPKPEGAPTPMNAQATAALLDQLQDTPTRSAVEALRAASPATFTDLMQTTRFAIADGATDEALAQLVLEALFSQFQAQALSLRSARSSDYQAIISGFAQGLGQLKTHQSAWCDGATIAAFLTQNEEDLVPSLLSEFPYQSPQYDWAMEWMVTVLSAMKQGQDSAQRHPRPGARDEAILQQTGLALGSEQWALALQIAAFANAEGTSYGQMQEVIAGLDVCELGIAVETVSGRLPRDVRARIWADLMPEIMVGNTPYVMYRVTDYFFIG